MALIDEEYVRISLRTQVFHMRFEDPFRMVFGLTILCGVTLFLSQGITNRVFLGLGLPLVTGVLSAAAVWILNRRYTFEVGPVGLTCYNFWGLRRVVPWDEMTLVRPVSALGLSYLRIRCSSLSSEIWLPLFVRDMSTLQDLVAAQTHELHPLRVALHDPARRG